MALDGWAGHSREGQTGQQGARAGAVGPSFPLGNPTSDATSPAPRCPGLPPPRPLFPAEDLLAVDTGASLAGPRAPVTHPRPGDVSCLQGQPWEGQHGQPDSKAVERAWGAGCVAAQGPELPMTLEGRGQGRGAWGSSSPSITPRPCPRWLLPQSPPRPRGSLGLKPGSQGPAQPARVGAAEGRLSPSCPRDSAPPRTPTPTGSRNH